MSDLGDRCAWRAAQALALAVALPFAASCGESSPPRPAAPREAPARDVVVRTGRFAIHANAYVDYYAWSLDATVRLDQDLVLRLGACSDDRCAKEALTDAKGATDGLDTYLRDRWPDHEQEARRILGLTGSPLMNLEDTIAPTLATQIGRVWPDEPIVLYLARGSGIDTHGECFEEGALLECLFTRGIEVLLPDSDLGRGIEEARAKLDDRAREATRVAIPCVAALVVDVAVAASSARYKPTPRFAEACAPGLRGWLGDAWAKRMHGEETSKAFGGKLVEMMAARAATP